MPSPGAAQEKEHSTGTMGIALPKSCLNEQHLKLDGVLGTVGQFVREEFSAMECMHRRDMNSASTGTSPSGRGKALAGQGIGVLDSVVPGPQNDEEFRRLRLRQFLVGPGVGMAPQAQVDVGHDDAGYSPFRIPPARQPRSLGWNEQLPQAFLQHGGIFVVADARVKRLAYR